MLWQIHNLTKRIKAEKTLRICERCNILYKKTFPNCPNCSGLDDVEIKKLLQQRAAVRINIGKIMLYGAMAIFIIMLAINGLISD